MAVIRVMQQRLCLGTLHRRAQHLGPDDLQRPAIVFSPHYDDETLGAGGTIVRKRQAGAPVHLVFMTDGSRSHAHAIDGVRLSAIRRAEALRASAVLGVPESHVHFLELPETRILEHRAEAVERVAELLARLRVDEVFVPSTMEPLIWSADHNVTTDVVFQALDENAQRPIIFEYLVWFWYHWPWVPLRRGGDPRRVLQLTWQNDFGLAVGHGLNTAVKIREVLEQKRVALEQYASQMTRLVHDRPWPVLSDMGGGDFLERFFQPAEFFKRYRYSRGGSGGMA